MAISDDASNSKTHIGVEELSADVSLREDSDVEGMRSMEVRPVPSKSAGKDQDRSEKSAILKFAEKKL